MKVFARIAQDFDADPTIAALPSDMTRYVMVLTILKGKKVGGRWESRAHWAAEVGRHRIRQLQRLIDSGLLEEMASGAIRIPPEKWKSWQVDPTNVQRQRDHREKQKGDNAGVTEK
jgi:hypothetical protein